MLFKYSGKYVNIYFNMKITYLNVRKVFYLLLKEIFFFILPPSHFAGV